MYMKNIYVYIHIIHAQSLSHVHLIMTTWTVSLPGIIYTYMYTQRYESLCSAEEINVNYPLIKKLKKNKMCHIHT